MPVERSRTVLFPVLIALLWAVVLGITVAPVALLFTLPVFLIAAPLAIGRYPAIGLVERLGRSCNRLRRRTERKPLRAGQGSFVPVSLRLVARLSGRAPPSSVIPTA